MTLTTGLLFVEYRFFKRQALTMMALKEDYQNHLEAINRVLEDYNQTKEWLEQLEASGEKKKLNPIFSVAGTDNVFPQGVKVFSSDGDSSADKDAFLTINRDPEYLKKSAMQYLRKHNIAARINPQETWADYTEQLLRDSRKVEQRKKRVAKRKRKKTGRNYCSHDQTAIDAQASIVKHAYDIDFSWPIERSQCWLSSFFGPRRSPRGGMQFHHGLDMAAVRGTPIYAVCEGVVVEARVAPGYGKTVVVAHNRKYKTRYAHLHTINVAVGQNVTRDTMIGKVGSTGCVRSKRGGDPSHLHFEVYVHGKRVNPMRFLT